MRFSVWPINQQPLREVLEVARHAASTGWDGVWISDHLMPAGPPFDVPVVECWTTMTTIIATVPGVRVGSLVLSNTFRHPGLLAKMAATLDAVDPGRLVLGLGGGWQVNEHDAYGIELPPAGERLRRLDDACSILRRLLRDGELDGSDDSYRMGHAVATPVPDVPIPLLIGVKGNHALGVAARHADEWNLWATPDVLRERSEVLRRHCDAEGRDPSTIRRSAQAVVEFLVEGAEPASRWAKAGLPMMVGTTGQMQDEIERYRAAGLDELIVPDFAFGRGAQRLESLDRFISEVAAPFRSQA